jgi:anti-sigma regulatory factor (Ser/Thr protein kinase)
MHDVMDPVDINLTNKFTIKLESDLEEDIAWRKYIWENTIQLAPKNIIDICHYGSTEMLNNVIDHSEGTCVEIELKVSEHVISIEIRDDGIGIFKKLQSFFQLEDPRHALLELMKGKLTTDPSRHSGEGLFFTSRIFDKFSLVSDSLVFTRFDEDHCFVETVQTPTSGTTVRMEIAGDCQRRIDAVFGRYATEEEDYEFNRTIIPAQLLRYGDELLISRSQARRLLARLECFKEVVLDFDGIDTIGQAFSDETFRVFRLRHPEVRLLTVNAGLGVSRMIQRAEASLRKNRI